MLSAIGGASPTLREAISAAARTADGYSASPDVTSNGGSVLLRTLPDRNLLRSTRTGRPALPDQRGRCDHWWRLEPRRTAGQHDRVRRRFRQAGRDLVSDWRNVINANAALKRGGCFTWKFGATVGHGVHGWARPDSPAPDPTVHRIEGAAAIATVVIPLLSRRYGVTVTRAAAASRAGCRTEPVPPRRAICRNSSRSER